MSLECSLSTTLLTSTSSNLPLEISNLIEQSVEEHLKEGKLLTYDLGGDSTCSAVGDAIAANLKQKLSQL